MENFFVVSIAIRDPSGIFSHEDISKFLKLYLPMLKKEGYSIDERRLHLIVLSNGGSASNIALRSFDKDFKTITFFVQR